MHTPNELEQQIIDDLLERYQFEYVPVRLTRTMLAKSIIDAREPLRVLLARSGLVEFAAIGQGPEHRIRLPIPFITAQVAASRTVSFYRPVAKQGDPRVWIERLGNDARPGDLLIFAFSDGDVSAILIKGDAHELVTRASEVLLRRYDDEASWESVVRRLSAALAKYRGIWIRTRRAGPTGVGYTLETLLGIDANTSQIADVDGVELKAYRRGGSRGEGKLVTLFSKTPEWILPNKGRGLLERYGYDRGGRRSLYCTITCVPNSLGFQLELLTDNQRIVATNGGVNVLAYTLATLEQRLKEKHPATLFIVAESRGRGANEEFRYDTIVLHREPSLSNFLDLTLENAIGLDLTLHLRDSGTARDHGYLWRIREPRLSDLFAYKRRIA